MAREKGEVGKVRRRGDGGDVSRADRPQGGARRTGRGAPEYEEREGEERLYGVVTSVYPDKGFGFVQEPNGTQRFFHSTASEIDLRNLRPGDEVSFIPTKAPKGPRAIEVRKES